VPTPPAAVLSAVLFAVLTQIRRIFQYSDFLIFSAQLHYITIAKGVDGFVDVPPNLGLLAVAGL